MYPAPERHHNQSCTPREFVDALDDLIRSHIYEHEYTDHEVRFDRPDFPEVREIIKRALTDYLIANSLEKGLAVQGEHR